MAGPGNRKSKGCARCRSRKIKCDEQRPSCERCKNAEVPCEYRPEKPIEFRSMNSKIESRVQSTAPRIEKRVTHRQRPKTNSTEERAALALKSANVSKAVHQASKTPSLVRAPNTHWEDPALCLFFQDYVMESDGASFGFLDSFPKLYGSCQTDVLTHAVSAISLASFSNQVRCIDLGVEARLSYSKALFAVKEALQDPVRATSDATMAGIICLNMYDMVCEDIPSQHLWGAHADALAMILRMRNNSEQFTNPSSASSAQAAHGIVVCRNLDQRLPPGPESALWERSVNTATHWAQVGLAYNRIARIIPVVDAALAEPINSGSSQRLLQAMSLCQAEDRSYRDWVAGNDSPFDYEVMDRSLFMAIKDDRAASLPPTIHVYSNTWAPSLWNTYRAARIVLLQTIFTCVEQASRHPDLADKFSSSQMIQQAILADIDQMVDDICSSIPFILGDVRKDTWAPKNAGRVKAFGGFTCLWVLRVLITVKDLGPERKNFIIQQLHYIAGKMGIRQADNIALIGYNVVKT